MRTTVLLKFLTLSGLISILLSAQSCTSDNIDDKYGPGSACDTAAVTFSQDIKTIIGQNCEMCHNGNSPSGGLNLAGHETSKTRR